MNKELEQAMAESAGFKIIDESSIVDPAQPPINIKIKNKTEA